MVVPETYDGYPVVAIGDYAFHLNQTLEKIVVGSNVKTVGEGAFMKMTDLKHLEFTTGTEELGDKILFGVDTLEHLTISSEWPYTFGDYFHTYPISGDIPDTLHTVEYAEVRSLSTMRFSNASIFDKQKWILLCWRKTQRSLRSVCSVA